MKIKPGVNEVVWFAAGVTVLSIVTLVVLHLHEERDPAAQLAFKARRADLVGRMQLDLASASEAEKSAVLATTDHDSQTFADQARSASANVEQERRELGGLLTGGGSQGERDLLAQFTAAFAEFQRIDDELLALTIKNTNVKAYSLAFGPADSALGEMNAALAHLVAANADSPEEKTVMRLAFGAEVGALRIQALLSPHIAEEDDKKMDEFEALMAAQDTQVRKGLDGLAALPKLRGDPELATATTRYAVFSNIRTQILALSRENTNVRSLSISLNQKRKAMRACEATLGALQEAILAEPIAGTTYGIPVRPR
jgi:heme exporter protein D